MPFVTRILQCAREHYKRACVQRAAGDAASPDAAEQATDDPWDSLTRHAAELAATLSAGSQAAQRDLALNGAMRAILDLLRLLTAERVGPTMALGSLLLVEQLLLSASATVWCLPRAQTMLLDSGSLDALARPLVASFERLSAADEPPASGDVAIYQATLLLLLSSQLENRPVQVELWATAERLGRGALAARLRSLSHMFYQMFDLCEHINLNHFHADEVAKGLRLLTHLLASEEEAPYLFIHMNGALDLLLRCLSNIDEEVLYAACCALFCLISRSPPARLLFLRKRGIGQLLDCVHDYNTAIVTTSLQILCLLAAENSAAREEMRREDVLLGVLRIVERFPAEDVTLAVLDAALEAVCHIVLDSPSNQEYVRTNGGMQPVVAALAHCAATQSKAEQDQGHNVRWDLTAPEGGGYAAASSGRVLPRPATAPGGSAARDPRRACEAFSRGQGSMQAVAPNTSASGLEPRPSDALKATEAACSALGNLVYRHSDNQRAALDSGVANLCLQLLRTPDACAHVAALSLLVNLADTNSRAQELLCTPESADAFFSLLTRSSDSRVLCYLCLLLSHAVWNHPAGQRLFGDRLTLQQLLSFLAAPRLPCAQAEAVPGAAAEGGREALVLYALMALVNLTYNNPEVQHLVRELSGIPLVQQQLSSAAYDVRRSASFCLGNLVKDNDGNACVLVSSGGLERLLLCLNDEDEDELSKTAYSTICQLGEPGLAKLLELVGDSLRALRPAARAGTTLPRRTVAPPPLGMPQQWWGTHVRPPPPLLREDEDSPIEDELIEDGLNGMCVYDAQEITVAREPPAPPPGRMGDPLYTAAVEQLERCLPVLNGMVYEFEDLRLAMAQRGGLATLLELLPHAPPHVEEEALHVLLNSLYGQPEASKLATLRLGAVGVLQKSAAAAAPAGEPAVQSMCYAVLCGLVDNCPRAAEEFLTSSAALQALLSSCSGAAIGSIGSGDAAREGEVQERATDLLLALCQDGTVRSALLASDVATRCLERVASASRNTLHAGKARQALAEHRGCRT